MKQIKQYIYAALVVIMATTTTSCLDDELISKRSEAPIRISATTQFSGINGRAILDESNMEVENYCLVYFNDIKNTGTLISVQDLGKLDTPQYVYLPTSSDTGFLAILLGNVTRNDLEQQGLKPKSTTVKDFKGMVNNVSKNDNQPTDSKKFTWSGYLPVNHDTENLAFKVNPNVAKITATITNSSSQSEVINVQIKDVVSTVRYGQNALSKANLFESTDNTNLKKVEGSNNYEQINYINYEIEELNLAKDESKTISWYVPHNECGEGSRPKDGNAGSFPANQKPTYIEIDGKRSVDYMDVAYKIYPGTGTGTTYENLDNFNILADNQYTLNITIADDGVTYNSVSQQNQGNTSDIYVEKIILPPLSNCYMIHPKYSDSVNPAAIGTPNNTTVYQMPIHERINQYWEHYTGSDNVIDESDKWVMEVIWQDISARAIHFTDETGSEDKDTFVGTGQTPVYFKLNRATLSQSTTSGGSDDIYGNILVGVKKADANGNATGDYLWSWHLWLTDYNPDAAPAPSQVSTNSDFAGYNYLYARNKDNTTTGQIDMQGEFYASSSSATTYSRNLFDGNVQHYCHTNSTYWTTKSSSVWDGNGIYANKWIMDRNLGAQSPNNADIQYPINGWGLYYQFGRKDPFSYSTTYDINGAKRSNNWKVVSTSDSSPSTISLGIQNPNTFYTIVENSQKKWASDANENSWFNPDWHTPEPSNKTGAKTLFDPCPPGWCIPVSDAFYFGTLSNVSGTNACFSIYVNTTTSFTNTSDKLRHFSFMISKNSSSTLYTSFPLQGYVKGENGFGTLVGTVENNTAVSTAVDAMRGCIWTNSYSGNGNATLIQIQPSETNTAGTSITPSTDSDRNGRTFKIYYAKMSIQNWITSRGQNVRCIQIPD